MFNVFALIFLVYIVYALLFMEIFGLTRYGSYTNEHLNFRSFGSTLLALFRMNTGESWDYIMQDTMIEVPLCTDDPRSYLNSDCGSTCTLPSLKLADANLKLAWALVLFITFNLLCTYILLNLFILVCLSAL